MLPPSRAPGGRDELVVARGAGGVGRHVLAARLALHDRPRDRPRAARTRLRDRLAALGLQLAQVALGAAPARGGAAGHGQARVAHARQRRAAGLQRGGDLGDRVALALGGLGGPALPREQVREAARLAAALGARVAHRGDDVGVALLGAAQERRALDEVREARRAQDDGDEIRSRDHVARAEGVGEQRPVAREAASQRERVLAGVVQLARGARQARLPGRGVRLDGTPGGPGGPRRRARPGARARRRDRRRIAPAARGRGRRRSPAGASPRRRRARAGGSRPTGRGAAAARRRAVARGDEESERRITPPAESPRRRRGHRIQVRREPCKVACGCGNAGFLRGGRVIGTACRPVLPGGRSLGPCPSCRAAPRRPTRRSRSRAARWRRRRRRGPRR